MHLHSGSFKYKDGWPEPSSGAYCVLGVRFQLNSVFDENIEQNLNKRRASADVKRIALAHVADLERRIAEMEAVRQTLQHLAHCCQGNNRPDCPILTKLAA